MTNNLPVGTETLTLRQVQCPLNQPRCPLTEALAQARAYARGLEREIQAHMTAEADLKIARDTALKASLAKSEFLANMSHEIRTPMNIIMGVTDLLQETVLDFQQHQYVATFKSAGESLLRLLDDILDLSKVESGRLELEQSPFNLADLLDETFRFLDIRAREKGLRLHYRIEPEAPVRLTGDAGRLRQVLTNIVGNAVKFTREGEVFCHVRRDSNGAAEGCLLFTVSDTGIGIREEQQGDIFESFSRAKCDAARQAVGTGLGLAISRRLVHLLGGCIWVESEYGAGSTFHFTARFQVQPDQAEVRDCPSGGTRELAVARPYTGAAPRLCPRPGVQDPVRILLVEDSVDNQMLVTTYLSKAACRVEVADNGMVAVEMFQSGSYDLVLMDMQMPEMDGYLATRLIREYERRRGGRQVPIVALTASALDDDRRKSLEAGCTAHLSKPIRKATLLETIRMLSETGPE